MLVYCTAGGWRSQHKHQVLIVIYDFSFGPIIYVEVKFDVHFSYTFMLRGQLKQTSSSGFIESNVRLGIQQIHLSLLDILQIKIDNEGSLKTKI